MALVHDQVPFDILVTVTNLVLSTDLCTYIYFQNITSNTIWVQVGDADAAAAVPAIRVLPNATFQMELALHQRVSAISVGGTSSIGRVMDVRSN